MASKSGSYKQNSDNDDVESYQGTVMGKWHSKYCDSVLNPFFFLDLWEPYEAKMDRSSDNDEITYVSYDDELSYEDEGPVNVLVAVQV